MFTSEQIRAALDASGYIHEQRVAERLSKLGMHVETNWIYLDADESKQRELDVRAYKFFRAEEPQGNGVAVELLIECKSGEAPYVLLVRDRWAYDKQRAPAHHVFPHGKYELSYRREDRGVFHNAVRYRKPYEHLSLFADDPQTNSDVVCTQFCRIARDGNRIAASHSDAYNSLVLPLAKAAAERVKYWSKFGSGSSGSGEKPAFVVLVFPIALVGGRVMQAATPGEEVRLTDVGYGTFVRRFDKYLDGDLFLNFVSSSSLEDFISNVVFPFASIVCEKISSQPKLFSSRAQMELAEQKGPE